MSSARLTIDAEDPRYHIISTAAPVIDTVTLREAVSNDYVSQFQVFNLGLRMSEDEEKRYKEITDAYYKAFAIFNNRFHSAMRCMQDRQYLSVFTRNLAGWDEQQVLNQARAFNRAMQARKQLIYKSATKRESAKVLTSLNRCTKRRNLGVQHIIQRCPSTLARTYWILLLTLEQTYV